MTQNFIHGTAGDDNLTGTSGADVFLIGQGGNDTASGLGGNDIFRMAASFTAADQLDGGAGSDMVVLNGDYTGENAVTFNDTTLVNVEFIRLVGGHSYDLTSTDATIAAGRSLIVHAEDLGREDALTFDGSAETDGHLRFFDGAGNDVLTGGAAFDIFDLSRGGSDTAFGNGGDDTFIFGGTFDNTDQIDGGAGDNIVRLDGNYSDGVVMGPATIANIKIFQFAPGNDYMLTANAESFAVGPVALINGSALGAGDSLTFDASASAADFHFIGGAGDDVLTGGTGGNHFDLSLGGSDTAIGGSGNNTFYMGAALDPTDVITGSGGGGLPPKELGASPDIKFLPSSNIIVLNGDYSAGFNFDGVNVTNINTVVAQTGHDYDLTFQDAFGAFDATVTVDGHSLGAGDTLTVDASAVESTNYVLIGGAGDDVLSGGQFGNTFTGGGGADDITSNNRGFDTFVYNHISDSTSVNYDTIHGYDDAFSTVIVKGVPLDPQNYLGITAGGALSTATFDHDLAAAITSTVMPVGKYLIFEPNSGTLAGQAFLVIDTNGHAGYQAGADIVIDITGFTFGGG